MINVRGWELYIFFSKVFIDVLGVCTTKIRDSRNLIRKE